MSTEDYSDALAATGRATLAVLSGLEAAFRHLHPPVMGELRELLMPHRRDLEATLPALEAAEVPGPFVAFQEQFLLGAKLTAEAVTLFTDPASPEAAIPQVLAAMGKLARANEALYAVHRFPPLSRFFVESPWHGRLEELDPDPPDGTTVGIQQTAGAERGATRGGFALYVPETYDGAADWPLVVALHGGSGNGRDFLWTWLREARGRRFLLLAPTSVGSTWSLDMPEVDARSLAAMLDYVRSNWRVDAARILLTGLSDGATYSFLLGLAEQSPFTAIAALSGVFHPVNSVNGNLERAAGRRIYLVHGKLDWMFPAAVARAAATELERAGADITYREIDDLSHTYARDENDHILSWFDPSLALPAAAES